MQVFLREKMAKFSLGSATVVAAFFIQAGRKSALKQRPSLLRVASKVQQYNHRSQLNRCSEIAALNLLPQSKVNVPRTYLAWVQKTAAAPMRSKQYTLRLRPEKREGGE